MSLLGTPTWPTLPGRVYSVWSFDDLAYTYWHDPAAPSDGGGGWNVRPGAAPTVPISELGDPIENLLTEVPERARYIGRGPNPRGEIAVKNRHATLWAKKNIPGGATGYQAVSGSDSEPSLDMAKWILIGGVAALVLLGGAKFKAALR